MKTRQLPPFLSVSLVAVPLLLTTGCNDEVLPPKMTNVTRGTTTVDIYGRWEKKLAVLGRGNIRQAYKLYYALAGSEIRVDKTTGAVTSGTLNGLDSAMIGTLFTVANSKATLSNPDATTDPNGRASVSVAPVSGPGGSETLTITIYYTNVFTAPLVDTDDFEVDLQTATAYE